MVSSWHVQAVETYRMSQLKIKKFKFVNWLTAENGLCNQDGTTILVHVYEDGSMGFAAGNNNPANCILELNQLLKLVKVAKALNVLYYGDLPEEA